MRFTPKTEEELKAEGLWKAGEYGFEVVDKISFGTTEFLTKDAISKIKEDGSGGNEMIQLALRVFNNDGNSIHLADYLLESAGKKLRDACAACGLLDKYDAGEVTAHDFIGKSGNLKLKIQEGKPKNDGTDEKYPDRNAVAGYLASFNGMKMDAQAPMKAAAGGFTDDSIPFDKVKF